MCCSNRGRGDLLSALADNSPLLTIVRNGQPQNYLRFFDNARLCRNFTEFVASLSQTVAACRSAWQRDRNENNDNFLTVLRKPRKSLGAIDGTDCRRRPAMLRAR